MKKSAQSTMDRQQLINDSGLSKLFNRPIPVEFINQCATIKVNKGETFFSIGDETNQVYLIFQGKVVLLSRNEQGDELILAEKHSNEYFGEDALLNLGVTKRAFCARAEQETQCLILPIDELKIAHEFNPDVEKLISETGSQTVFNALENSFKSIHESKIDVSKIQGERKHYIDREVIFFQHDEPDYTYYITSGAVDLRSAELDEKDKILLTLEENEIFGELGVLNNEQRLVTAVARGETELILIDKENTKRMHKEDPQFQKVVKALKHTYALPQGGRVRRYAGDFLGIPAICNHVVISKEKTVVSYQIVGNEIFCISVQGVEDYECHFFHKGAVEQREIWVKDGVLVGVITYGYWEDTSAFAQMIFHETAISQQSIDHFLETGTLLEKGLLKALGNILCQCMQVTYQEVASLITGGENSMDQIIQFTGAGSVCGACKINIQEMLGSNVWTLCKLTKTIKHNDDIWSFQFTPLDPHDKVSFIPGQHVVLRFHIKEGWVERPYTLTSHPDNNFYELTIKREEKGVLSRWLFDHAQEGMISYLSNPLGDYTFESPLQKPTIFFAGGIGITPAIVMGKMINGNGRHAFYLDYSYRSQEDIICEHFFEQVAQASSHFKVNLRQTSEEGRLSSEEIQQSLSAYDNPDIYICGPTGFIQDIENILKEELKIPTERIFIEEFTHLGGPQRSDV